MRLRRWEIVLDNGSGKELLTHWYLLGWRARSDLKWFERHYPLPAPYVRRLRRAK